MHGFDFGSKCCMPLIFWCSSGVRLDFFFFLQRLGSGEVGTVDYVDLYSLSQLQDSLAPCPNEQKEIKKRD